MTFIDGSSIYSVSIESDPPPVAIVTVRGNRPETRGTVWRRLRKLIARRSENFRRLLTRGEDPASSSTQPTAPGSLWDPWLDARAPQREDVPEPTSSVEGAAGESAGEIGRRGARVRPRVLSSETGASLPLADMIGPILAGGESGVIRLVGLPGSGKTTALEYLAGVVPPHLNVSFLDDPHRSAIEEAASRGWVVSTSNNASHSVPSDRATNLRLAPWGEDEWIEYLLASDRQTCASVMARLARCRGPSRPDSAGSPSCGGRSSIA